MWRGKCLLTPNAHLLCSLLDNHVWVQRQGKGAGVGPGALNLSYEAFQSQFDGPRQQAHCLFQSRHVSPVHPSEYGLKERYPGKGDVSTGWVHRDALYSQHVPDLKGRPGMVDHWQDRACLAVCAKALPALPSCAFLTGASDT